MTNTNGVSSEERDNVVATSLPENGDGVEEDILEQEIPSFIAFLKKCTIEINGDRVDASLTMSPVSVIYPLIDWWKTPIWALNFTAKKHAKS